MTQRRRRRAGDGDRDGGDERLEPENARLRCLARDLVSLTSLAAVRIDRELAAIANDVLDAVVSLVRLDFAYVRLDDLGAARGQSADVAGHAREIDAVIARLLARGRTRAPAKVPNPIGAGDVRVAVLGLGTGAEWGVLASAAARASFPTDDERLLLETAANQATIVFRAARLLAETRRAEARIEEILASVTDSVMALDRELRVTYVNPRAEDLAGKSKSKIVGRPLRDAFPRASFARYQRAIDDGVMIDFERYDGATGHWWGVRAYPSETGLTVYARDLTADKELGLLTAMLEASHDAATLDLPDVVEKVAERFRQHFRWDLTALWIYDAVEQGLRLHTLSHPPGGRPAISEDEVLPLKGTVSGRAFTTGAPIVANTLAEFEAFAADSARRTRDAGYRSACAVPLVTRGRVLGTLVANSQRERVFDPEAVEILTRIAQVIAPVVDNALAYRKLGEFNERLARENVYLSGEVGAQFAEIVGASEALERALAEVRIVADTDAAVLISGETGTGKELIARAIHRLSGRADHPFVKLNCAAIPASLLESELFGHEKGAFTGAVAQRIGRFELGNGGTVFLDEIGELPLELQPKLLRVLQDHEFERVGGTKTIRADVRLIAATNRELGDMIAEGSFRKDLYYRLNVFPIRLPPLRERREDIELLAWHFVERCARRYRKTIKKISAATLDALARYDWPGNVRELENLIERSVILTQGAVLEVRLAELPPQESAGRVLRVRTAHAEPRTLAAKEREWILRAIEETDWVVGGRKGAAARLGLNRTTLQARMRKLRISRPK